MLSYTTLRRAPHFLSKRVCNQGVFFSSSGPVDVKRTIIGPNKRPGARVHPPPVSKHRSGAWFSVFYFALSLYFHHLHLVLEAVPPGPCYTSCLSCFTLQSSISNAFDFKWLFFCCSVCYFFSLPRQEARECCVSAWSEIEKLNSVQTELKNKEQG